MTVQRPITDCHSSPRADACCPTATPVLRPYTRNLPTWLPPTTPPPPRPTTYVPTRQIILTVLAILAWTGGCAHDMACFRPHFHAMLAFQIFVNMPICWWLSVCEADRLVGASNNRLSRGLCIFMAAGFSLCWIVSVYRILHMQVLRECEAISPPCHTRATRSTRVYPQSTSIPNHLPILTYLRYLRT